MIQYDFRNIIWIIQMRIDNKLIDFFFHFDRQSVLRLYFDDIYFFIRRKQITGMGWQIRMFVKWDLFWLNFFCGANGSNSDHIIKITAFEFSNGRREDYGEIVIGHKSCHHHYFV